MATFTWGTAADWDARQAESGVVHEAAANTDYTDAGVIRNGYSVANPIASASLLRWWPMHEDTGTVAYDLSANAAHGDNLGATPGATGLRGTSAYSFDGVDDHINVTLPSMQRPLTVIMWVQLNGPNDGSDDFLFDMRDTIPAGIYGRGSRLNSTVTVQIRDTGGWKEIPITVDTAWTQLALVVDTAEIRGYKDGGLVSTLAVADYNATAAGGTPSIGAGSTGVNPHNGRIAGAWVYGTAFSSAQIQQHYEAIAGPGTLTTAVKR